MNIIRIFTAVFVAALSWSTSVAYAAMSDWEDLGGGKARLVAVLDPGTMEVEAALEVKLDKGWSTYWRYPGSSGIPPMFDFSGSRGFVYKGAQYPVPALQGDGRIRYAGYKNSVTFPLNGKMIAASGGRITLKILIGVCEEICIPAQASFTIDGKELLQSDFRAASIISLGKTKVPQTRDANEFLLGRELKPGGEMFVRIRHEKSTTEPALFVEGPRDWYLTPAKIVSTSDTETTFSINVSSAPKDADYLKTPLTFTLATNGNGVEFSD